MSDMAVSMFILLVFWAAQLFFCSWFYFRPKPEHSSKPPVTDEDEAELDRIVAEHFPPRQTKGLSWYLTHPIDILRLLPALPRIVIGGVLFLPVLLFIWLLQSSQRR